MLDTSRRLGAPPCECVGLSQHVLQGLVALAGEGCKAFVERIDGRETSLEVGLEAEERLDRLHSVLALQTVDDVQAIIDVRHALGIEVDILLEVIDIRVQVFEIKPCGADPLGVIGRPRQVVLDSLHQPERLMQADQGSRVVVAQHARGAEECFADLFGM